MNLNKGLDYSIEDCSDHYVVTLENPYLSFNVYPQEWWDKERLHLELARATRWLPLIQSALDKGYTLEYYEPVHNYSIRAKFNGCKPFTILNSQQRLLMNSTAYVLDCTTFNDNLTRITAKEH